MNFWARASVSSLLFGCITLSLAQPYGSSLFDEEPSQSGVRVTREGIQVDGSIEIQFSKTGLDWKPLERGVEGVTWGSYLSTESYWKLRLSCFQEGLSLYIPKGESLRFETPFVPFLSWSEASTGPGVETAPSPWTILTFGGEESILGLATQPDLVQWKIDRASPTTFQLAPILAPESLGTWVQVVILKQRGRTTNVDDLASIVQTYREALGRFSPEPFQLIRFSANQESSGLTARFKLNRSGAKLNIGGFATPAEGALLASKGEIFTQSQEFSWKLKWFGVPEGRAIVARGKPIIARPKGQRGLPSLAYALDFLFAEVGPGARGALAESETSFLTQASSFLEPLSQSTLLFGPRGEQAELLAVAAAQRSFLGGENPYLANLMWGLDLGKWRLHADPEGRVAHLLLPILLSGDSAMNRFRVAQCASMARPKQDTLASELWEGVFLNKPSRLWNALSSPLRLLSGPQIRAYNSRGGYKLIWKPKQTGGFQMKLLAKQELKITAKSPNISANIDQIMNKDGTYYAVTVSANIKKIEECWVELKSSNEEPMPILPKAVEYSDYFSPTKSAL